MRLVGIGRQHGSKKTEAGEGAAETIASLKAHDHGSKLANGNLASRAVATSLGGSVVVGHLLTSSSSASDHAFVWTAKCGMLDL